MTLDPTPAMDDPTPCPECGAADAEYGQHEPGCPSGFPTREELPPRPFPDPEPNDDEPGRDTVGPVPEELAADLGDCPDCGHPLAGHDQPGDTEGLLSCYRCAAAGRVCDVRIGGWTTADTAALAVEMGYAAEDIAARWSDALRGGRMHRVVMVARTRMTREELATGAARMGIVADGDALTRVDEDRATAAGRMHELVGVWNAYTAWSRGLQSADGLYAQTHDALVASHDAFEELHAIRIGEAIRNPIYALGLAILAAHGPATTPGRLDEELRALPTAATIAIREKVRPV